MNKLFSTKKDKKQTVPFTNKNMFLFVNSKKKIKILYSSPFFYRAT